MNEPFITFRPPPDYASFLLTFKDADVHPFDQIKMKGKAVRIYAPSANEAKEVVRHRFGNAFKELHIEAFMRSHRFVIHEQLIWKEA